MGSGAANLREQHLDIALPHKRIVVELRNERRIRQRGQLLDMPEAHLENIFCTVVQQEGQLRIAVLGNICLTDTQRDASHRQVKRIEQAIRGPFIGEFSGDEDGDAAEFIDKELCFLLMVPAPGQRFER